MSTTTREQLATAAQEAAQQQQAALTALENLDRERDEALAARQRAWDLDLIQRHRDLDETLVASSRDHQEAFRAAVAAGDFNAAIKEWVAQHSIRNARRILRGEANTAEQRQQTGQPMLPGDLTYYPTDLLEQIERAAEASAAEQGADLATTLVGEYPTEHEA